MNRRLVLAAVAIVVVLAAALSLWFASDASVARGAGEQAPTAAAAEPAAGTTPDAAAATLQSTAADAARVPAPVHADTDAGANAESRGELLVRVVWADGEQAPGVRVYVSASVPGASRPLVDGVADERGEVRARVPAGKVRATSDRGGRAEADVAAGASTEVELKLEAGVDVIGTVRAAGAPVPGAQIWLTSFQSPWCAGAFVATADANGAFALRAVPKKESLGAVAAGFQPSKLVDLELLDTSQPPVPVELVLEPGGGALAGRVTDEQGKPVAGAIVAVGALDRGRTFTERSGNTRQELWAPRRAVTDDDGRYAMVGLATGAHPVEVWARAFPFWHGTTTIEADRTAQLDVVLPRPVTVFGTVTGENGKPLAGAVVRCFPCAIETPFLQGGQYDYDTVFGYPFAIADGEGRYRLLRAAPRELHLYASPGGMRRRDSEPFCWADAVLPAEPGAVVEWNARIEPGPTIRGVVRWRDGTPMEGVFVSLLEPDGPNRHGQAVVNDREGRFRFVRLAKKAYDVTVQVWDPPKGAAPVEARNVWPDSGELELKAAFDPPKKEEPGSVSGRVVDSAGRVRGKVSVLLASERSWRTDNELEDGVFRFEKVEPGQRRIVVMSDEDPVLYGPWFDLGAAANVDLGTIVTEPGGTLRLRILRAPGAEEAQPTVYLSPTRATHARKVVLPAQVDELLVDNLCAGEHRLSMYGKGVASVREGRCTVVAGEETAVTIELHAAVERTIVVESTAEQRVTRILVAHERGDVLFDFRPTSVLVRPYRMPMQMALGRHTFRVETDGGGIAETMFEMTSLEPDQPPVVLRAK